MSTEAQRKELLGLSEKATPRPWPDHADFGAVMCLPDNRSFAVAAAKLAPDLAREVEELTKAIQTARTAPHTNECYSRRRKCSVCGVQATDHAFFNNGNANPCPGGIYEQRTPCNCWKAALVAGKVGE